MYNLTDSSRRLAMFVSTLQCGGAERVVVNLLRAADARGIPLDLVLARAEGPLLAEVPASVRIVELGVQKLQQGILGLARYLRRERPAAIVSHLTQANVALLIARLIARTDARVAVVEHSNLTANLAAGLVRPRVALLARRLYRGADAVIAVSTGAARDVEQQLELPAGSVRPIFNPVVDERLTKLAAAACDPWPWHDDCPVLLAVGRLAPEKDYPNLLTAFAQVRQSRRAKLMIFGEGPERAKLEELRDRLGLADEVLLPGITANPFAAMRRAAMLVLSSRFEGLGNVLIEALACGCPVVSTDCPAGPAEILAGGRFGLLVPPERPEALAAGILRALDQPWDRAAIRRRGHEFSADRALDQYLDALGYRWDQATSDTRFTTIPDGADQRHVASVRGSRRSEQPPTGSSLVNRVSFAAPKRRSARPRLAVFLPSLHGGGAERMMVNLLRGISAAGIPADLLLARAEGPYLADVPSDVRIIDLAARQVRRAVWPLARYLRRERPCAILSRMLHANLATLIAARLARVPTKVAVIEAVHLSAGLASGEISSRLVALARWLYRRAHAIVGVSAGVSRDLEHVLGLPADRVQTIYNPVVDASLSARCGESCPHPWLADDGPPVLISVGRLEPQKDHATLLRAFARMHRRGRHGS